MKLSTLSFLVAGVGLLQASASPLRVIMVSETHQESSIPNLRFGLPVANNNNNGLVAHIVPTPLPKAGKGRFRPCKAMKDKAKSISEAFKQAFGGKSDGAVHILPFLGTPETFVNVKMTGVEGTTQGGDRVHFGVPHRHVTQESFMRRVHIALMTLGPWEGRAVAFVLGCGIGVLLRMFWVLAIISYRAIKGAKKERAAEYDYIVFEHYGDAEEIVVPPPTYVVDEKVPVEEVVVAKTVAEESK
jgi:hypothetical protein